MNLRTCNADYVHSTFTKVPADRFDDFTITHIKKREVRQINHYYPFGLTMSGAVNSPNVTNTVENNRLFSAGSELQELSNLYDTYYRQYDASLGRFNAIDPKATSFTSTTPYNFAFNDPVALNDPLGDCPTCWYNFDENGASQQLSTIQRIQYQGDSYFRNRSGLVYNHNFRAVQLASDIVTFLETSLYRSGDQVAASWTPDGGAVYNDPVGSIDNAIAYINSFGAGGVEGGFEGVANRITKLVSSAGNGRVELGKDGQSIAGIWYRGRGEYERQHDGYDHGHYFYTFLDASGGISDSPFRITSQINTGNTDYLSYNEREALRGAEIVRGAQTRFADEYLMPIITAIPGPGTALGITYNAYKTGLDAESQIKADLKRIQFNNQGKSEFDKFSEAVTYGFTWGVGTAAVLSSLNLMSYSYGKSPKKSDITRIAIGSGLVFILATTQYYVQSKNYDEKNQ